MKTVFLAAAAVLIASSAAQAGSSIAFNFDGHKIRVTVPRNCQSLSCLQVSGIDLSGLTSSKLGDDAPASSAPAASAPAPAAAAPAAPVVNAPAPVTAAPAVAAPAPTAPASVAPSMTGQMPVPPAPASATAPAPQPAPAPAPVTVAAAPAAVQPAPAAADPNSPLGLWATEGGKGNVVIEPCGANICGFAEKTREKILINMKPKDSKWVGRIHDPDGGGNYDSTVVLKNPNTLRVQGCAFGGLFCGGQTWKRVS